MTDNRTAINSTATRAQDVRRLADGIYAFADELQGSVVDQQRHSKVRKLAANFLIFVNDSMDEGMLKGFEDDLDFLEGCMDVFTDVYDVENLANEPAQDPDANDLGLSFTRADVLAAADEFKTFLGDSALVSSRDAYDFVLGSLRRFVEIESKLQ